ncbi:MAG: hypothetical protein IJ583_03295 [Firmicutes bacterium]|nr:hypothetical protein [Bacillota bacterium]
MLMLNCDMCGKNYQWYEGIYADDTRYYPSETKEQRDKINELKKSKYIPYVSVNSLQFCEMLPMDDCEFNGTLSREKATEDNRILERNKIFDLCPECMYKLQKMLRCGYDGNGKSKGLWNIN